jgi:hypothetical protein
MQSWTVLVAVMLVSGQWIQEVQANFNIEASEFFKWKI